MKYVWYGHRYFDIQFIKVYLFIKVYTYTYTDLYTYTIKLVHE